MFDLIQHTQPGSYYVALMTMWRCLKSRLRSSLFCKGEWTNKLASSTLLHPHYVADISVPSLDESWLGCPLDTWLHPYFLHAAHWQQNLISSCGHWTSNSSALETKKYSQPLVLWHIHTNKGKVEGASWDFRAGSEPECDAQVDASVLLGTPEVAH